MKLGPDEQSVLREIEDEAIASCRRDDGRVDHVAAALHRRDALAELEAGGVGWAASARESAENEGHRKAIARRLKATAVSIPAPAGAVTLPTTYSRRDADGGQQMTFWLFLPLDELEALAGDLIKQSKTLNDRALAMRYGLDLARRHDVDTAAQGFAAEGIDVAEVA